MFAPGDSDEEDAGAQPANNRVGFCETWTMLLFILIPIAWLGVLSLLVAICRTAAEGERTGVGAERVGSVAIGPRLVLVADSHESPPRQRRAHPKRALRHGVRTRPARVAQLNR